MTPIEAPEPDNDWTRWRTRFILFTGKGGVGKTTAAAALAVALSDQGRRVLIVSTDPASNLSGVFTTQVGNTPTSVPGVQGLDAMDIDPQAAADSYRARVLDPLRDTMPAADIDAVAEQLAGQCTVEVAAFDEFSGLLAAPEITAAYDHIIFDTAPTGHTLRLLELPAAWSNFIETNPDGASCLGPLSALGTKRSLYQDTVAALGDPTRTTVVLVARPERAALAEAERAGNELAALGVTNQRLIINGVLTAPLAGDPVAEAFAGQQHDAIQRLPVGLATLPVDTIALAPYDLTGIASLRWLTGRGPAPAEPVVSDASTIPLQDLDALIADLAEAGPGVVMVMGKGGVGKTTVAKALAHGLAAAGCPTHLASTDPAGRLDETPGSNLTTSWIDPRAETQRYIDSKLARAADLDDDARDLLARGPPITVHRGTRRLRRLLEPAPSRATRTRRHRHRTHRPHTAPPRPDRLVPSRHHACQRWRGGSSLHAAHAASRSDVHACPHRHARPDHTDPGSDRTAARPPTRRYRTVRLDHQRQPRRQRHDGPGAPPACRPRARPHPPGPRRTGFPTLDHPVDPSRS